MLIREENQLIKLISMRASLWYQMKGTDINHQFIADEIRTVHKEICELRLKDLLDASISDFTHDITGIHANLDMLDASFRNGFSPRFANTKTYGP